MSFSFFSSLLPTLFLTFLLSDLKAEESTISPPTTTKTSADLATEAAKEQLPRISSSILRTEFQREQDKNKKTELAIRLTRLLLHQRNPKEAFTLLESLSSDQLNRTPHLIFWEGAAALQSGHPKKAMSYFNEILHSDQFSSPSLEKESYQIPLLLSLAIAERLVGKLKEAKETLQHIDANYTSLLSKKEKELFLEERVALFLEQQQAKKAMALLKEVSSSELIENPRLLYYKAIALLQQGNPSEALQTLHKIHSYSSWLGAASTSLAAEAQEQKEAIPKSQLLLEKYIDEHPEAPLLGNLLDQLEYIYLLEKNNDPTLLKKWSNDTTHSERANHATLPYARMLRRLGHYPDSEKLLANFLKKNNSPALNAKASLELAQIKLLEGNPKEALTCLIPIHQDGKKVPTKVEAAAYFIQGLAETDLEHPKRALEAFEKAAQKDAHLATTAQENQRLITEEFSPMLSKNLPTTSTQDLNNPQEQKALDVEKAYHSLFSAKSDKTLSERIIIARRFLKDYPSSPLCQEVSLKLGADLLANHESREARMILEQLGWSQSKTELGRKALLLAAKAAATSMNIQGIDDALMLLEEVAQEGKGGTETWQARLEQASLKNTQQLPYEAISIYDQVINSTEASTQLQAVALMARGDTLHNLGPETAQAYQEAISSWRKLATTEKYPLPLRNEALCKIGMSEETLGENDAALTDFYQAMKATDTSAENRRWHDLAAFHAAALLEKEKNWKDAIRLYQAIEAEKGPRSNEATHRISKLRLDNLLWDE